MRTRFLAFGGGAALACAIAVSDRQSRRDSTRGPADSFTDRSLYDRCITRGLLGSMLPDISACPTS